MSVEGLAPGYELVVSQCILQPQCRGRTCDNFFAGAVVDGLAAARTGLTEFGGIDEAAAGGFFAHGVLRRFGGGSLPGKRMLFIESVLRLMSFQPLHQGHNSTNTKRHPAA